MKEEKAAPAVACLLDPAHYRDRVGRFAKLNRESLLRSSRSELGVELVYSPNAADELRELVRLEEQCCPFLRFRLEEDQNSVKLSIAAPESARDSIETLLEPFLAS